jgi:hypothetical protein
VRCLGSKTHCKLYAAMRVGQEARQTLYAVRGDAEDVEEVCALFRKQDKHCTQYAAMRRMWRRYVRCLGSKTKA